MESEGSGISPEPQPTLPPRLEHYLPPDLWRKLNEAAPRRGVLLNALERLRSVLYLLSTYLPQHLVQEKMRRPAAGMVRGQLLSGNLLFADVSGFTALSERLAALGEEGAERLTDLMNVYFERMLKILAWSGGILLKFAGDALLVYFAQQEDGEQARWATRAGLRMMRAMAEFAEIDTLGDGADAVALRMKIGIGAGSFLAASVGAAERMEYVVLGDTVARTMSAEGAAQAGQVVVDEATAAHLGQDYRLESVAGFCAVSPETNLALDDFEIKAERRRARGAIPWSAKPHAIVAQMEIALRQIEALAPYLPAELVERIVVQASRRQVESEFRPTTVLFMNFTGLERLLAAWGRGGVRRATGTLNDYFQAMYQIIVGHGGVISRIDPYSQGSKMLVLFGAPVAHEDDPLRAVEAALAMHEELAKLNEQWREDLARHLPAGHDGPLLEQRIGITQGHTFAGQAGSATRREYTVMGDDVNLSARLMSAAEPGQILISQRVYDAVVDHISATALPAIRVKGKSRPIPIYQPTGPRDDPLACRLRNRGPLVGREAELERVWTVLNEALSGRGAALTIAGPAGVGKSCLADRLISLALARGCQVLFALCRAYHADAPYAPWISLLRAWAGIGPADDADVRRDKLLPSLAALDLAADEYAEPLGNLLGVARAHDAPRRRLPDESLASHEPATEQAQPALFARLAQKVADADADREDKSVNLWQLVRERQKEPAGQMWQTLQARLAARQQERLFEAFARLLARLAAQGPLLLFFESAQWMDPASRDLLQTLGERLSDQPVLLLLADRREGAPSVTLAGGQILSLGALSHEATAIQAGQLWGAPLDEDLADAIYVQSGGNPLFVEELLGWMQRSGRSTLGDLQVSVTLQELVLSRVDSLPHNRRDVVRRASVVGSEFSRSAVRALLSEEEGVNSLQEALDGLEDARLVLRAGANGDVRYAFQQTLVREVVYNSQSFARRRDMHARLAGYLEAQHGGDLAGHAELLAHHYERGDCAAPAARYLILSGAKARERVAYPQAAAYFDRALKALAQSPPEDGDGEISALRAQAHEGQGDIALLRGDFAAATDAYEAAHAGLNGAAVEARLLVKLALALPTQGRAAEGLDCARQALALRGETDSASAAVLAWLLWREGSPKAGEWIERTRNLAGKDSGRWAASVRALVDDFAGDWSSAARAYQAAEQPVGAALAACRLGDLRLDRGDLEGALELYAQAAEIWKGESDAAGLALAFYRQAGAHRLQGDASAAWLALFDAGSLLNSAELAAPDDRSLIRRALEVLEADSTDGWPSWHPQCYDDAFRISILFRP